MRRPIFLFFVAATACLAQTTVNGSRTIEGKLSISGSAAAADFTSASETAPIQTGTSLPASCRVGDVYFKSDEPAGLNLFVCASNNVWQRQSYGMGLQSNLPAGCTPGQLYFETDAPAGDNLIYCTSANTWTQPSGGSGGVTPTISGTYAARPGCSSANSGQFYYATDSVYGFRCNGSSWESYIGSRSVTLPGPVSSWSQVGPATNTTIQDSSGAIWFDTTDTTGSVRGLIQSAPAAPWTRTFAFLPDGFAGVSDNAAGCGLLLTDGNPITAGKQLWWGIDRKGSTSPRLSLYEFTNGAYTSVVNTASYNTNAPTSGLLYLRVSETGGGTPTRTLSISVDGMNFSTFYTGSATTWLTTADYGFGCNPVPAATDSNAATLVGVQ